MMCNLCSKELTWEDPFEALVGPSRPIAICNPCAEKMQRTVEAMRAAEPVRVPGERPSIPRCAVSTRR